MALSLFDEAEECIEEKNFSEAIELIQRAYIIQKDRPDGKDYSLQLTVLLGSLYLLDDRMLSCITHMEHVVAITKNFTGGEYCRARTNCEVILREAYEKVGRRLCG